MAHRPSQVSRWYRRRFGIDSTYRQLNYVRARTASRSPALLLLLVGIALMLVNLHLTLCQACLLATDPTHGPAASLAGVDRLADLVRQAVELWLGGP